MNKTKTDLAIYMRAFFDGGVERIILNLAQGFVAQGLKVDLLVNQVSKSIMLERLPPEVEIVDLRANKFFKYFPKLINYLRQKNQKLYYQQRIYLLK